MDQNNTCVNVKKLDGGRVAGLVSSVTAGRGTALAMTGGRAVAATEDLVQDPVPPETAPLSGLTVLDLGQIYQGPYCALLLALAGARVIKIEPLRGEPARRRADAADGAFPVVMLNSNKLGVTLNLKAPAGRALLARMAARADVLVENFAPGVLDRLGVGAEALRTVNPRLIFASASGFGSSGPDRDELAMDLTIQAKGGAMSVTGWPGGPPTKAGPALCDFLGGVHLYGAIVTALFQRERTGRGQRVEVAMQDALFPSLASALGMLQASGQPPQPTGNRHSGLAMAPYNVYRAADGWLAVICVTEEHWQNLARLIGRAELIDAPDWATHAQRAQRMAEVDALVETWTCGQTKAALMAAMRLHHVPAAPVRDLAEVIADVHLHQRGMLQRLVHPEVGEVVVPHSPLLFPEQARLPLRPSPRLGQDNQAVYGDWLGLEPAELADLAAAGVI